MVLVDAFAIEFYPYIITNRLGFCTKEKSTLSTIPGIYLFKDGYVINIE